MTLKFLIPLSKSTIVTLAVVVYAGVSKTPHTVYYYAFSVTVNIDLMI